MDTRGSFSARRNHRLLSRSPVCRRPRTEGRGGAPGWTSGSSASSPPTPPLAAWHTRQSDKWNAPQVVSRRVSRRSHLPHPTPGWKASGGSHAADTPLRGRWDLGKKLQSIWVNSQIFFFSLCNLVCISWLLKHWHGPRVLCLITHWQCGAAASSWAPWWCPPALWAGCCAEGELWGRSGVLRPLCERPEGVNSEGRLLFQCVSVQVLCIFDWNLKHARESFLPKAHLKRSEQ